MPPKKKRTGKQKVEARRKESKPADTSLPADSLPLLAELGQDPIADEVGTEYQKLLVREFERRVHSLQTHLNSLSEENEHALYELENIDKQHGGHIAELKSKLKQRVSEVEELGEQLEQKRSKHKREKEKWLAAEQDLEFVKHDTEERMTAENRILAAELNALEEFYAKRESILHQCLYFEKCLERMEHDHARDLAELEEQNLEDRSQLKREAVKRLEDAALEFRTRAEEQLQPLFKNLLSENVSLESELIRIADAIYQLTKENADLIVSHRTLLREHKELKNEHVNLATRSSAATKLTHLLTVHEARLADVSEEGCSGSSSIIDPLERQCEGLEKQEGGVAKALELSKNKLEHKKATLTTLQEYSSSHVEWMSETAKCLSKATERVQTLLSCLTADNTGKKQTEEIVSESIQLLLPALVQPEFTDNDWMNLISQDITDDLNDDASCSSEETKSELYSSDDDRSETSGISEPHGTEIDESIEISEPESTSDEESVPICAEVKADQVAHPDHFQQLEQIGETLPPPLLDTFFLSSKEWREQLDIFTKNLPGSREIKDDSRLSGDQDGYLLPGDLNLIPHTGEVISTAKEQTRLLKQYRVKQLLAPLVEKVAVKTRRIGTQTQGMTRMMTLDEPE